MQFKCHHKNKPRNVFIEIQMKQKSNYEFICIEPSLENYMMKLQDKWARKVSNKGIRKLDNFVFSFTWYG